VGLLAEGGEQEEVSEIASFAGGRGECLPKGGAAVFEKLFQFAGVHVLLQSLRMPGRAGPARSAHLSAGRADPARSAHLSAARRGVWEAHGKRKKSAQHSRFIRDSPSGVKWAGRGRPALPFKR
jgi:hypothetical protein